MNRTGFHYFPDTEHYKKTDLKKWLPELKGLGVAWLVLDAPIERAIPEYFIRGVIDADIEPVLHFKMKLGANFQLKDIALLFSTYAKWGVNYIIFFEKPNERASWNGARWSQSSIVDSFLDLYIPLAEIAISEGISLVYPPLEPGGDYWDTAFLRASLSAIERRGHEKILKNIVFSAYARLQGHSLNWGAGGPERWPGVSPYYTPDGEEDQRGFRIADWYQAEISAILNEPKRIILLGVGQPEQKDLRSSNNTSSDAIDNNDTVFKLLADINVDEIEPLSKEVICVAFWLLSAEANHEYAPLSWFNPNGGYKKSVHKLREFSATNAKTISSHGIDNLPITHYLLLPSYEWGITDWHLQVIRPFVKKHKPTVGFSLNEAKYAKKVTVIGGENMYSDTELNRLRANGAFVERVDGDGTSIASRLAAM